ncbi:MAG TPA: hypothetical protein VK002_05525 [Rubricoccaceae bacterium]|jgi:predicted CopG family antitoxin|nr:hypothetical protein [Rubricoccaceae bacterium]
MPAIQSKDEIVKIVQSLPEEASLDDVIERLILLRKVNLGLAQRGQGLPQSVAEAEFRKPRQERSWNRG